MEYATLGSTGLKVSVAGLGCGGFSRLGMAQGKTESEAADVVRTALDLGVNYLDTAATYGTEGAVGLAIRGRPRDELVIATKVRIDNGDRLLDAAFVRRSLDASLKALGVDVIDVYQVHGPAPHMYDHVMEVVVPVIQEAQKTGKVRHIGITESDVDHHHEVSLKAADTGVFEVVLLAFHMMHQTARDGLFDKLIERNIGSVVMYAVRSLYSRPDRLRQVVAELAAVGKIPVELAQAENPLDFLVHADGARTVTEAAYRFARHQKGVDVVLFGTGNHDHVGANVSAILKPALPAADIARLETLFRGVAGVGLDRHGLPGGSTNPHPAPA